MQEKHSLTLVIPCYNEEKTIEMCIEKCMKLRDKLEHLELIVIDDCSSDNSFSILKNIAEKYKEIKLIRHEVNQGKGAALRTGFRYASCEYVGVQDADMEYAPQDYIKLISSLVKNKADVVYGSRYLRRDSRRVLYFWHTWMNRSLTFVSNMFTNLDLTDMETCYKLFKLDVIQKLIPMLNEDRFGFEPEITCLVARLGLRVHECAIHYEPRSYMEGKKIGWRDGVRALYCILHYGAPYAPLPMQLILYFFIGTACAIINLIAFIVILSVGISLMPAAAIAFILAAASNYLLCLCILFRHKARWSALGELAVYTAGIVVMGVLDIGMTNVLACLGLSPLWSKVWASLVGFIGNFVLRKYFVF